MSNDARIRQPERRRAAARLLRGERGLTLVELLVAISVLAFVAVLGWRGLDSIVRARVALNSDLEHTRGMQLAFAQLQNDCARIVESSVLSGRAPIAATNDRLMLVRKVFVDGQPSRVQVVVYQLDNGVLTRRESPATRDLAELDQLWRAAQAGELNAQAVELQSALGDMTIRLWADDKRGWRTPPAIGEAGAAGASSATNRFPESTTPGSRVSKGSMAAVPTRVANWTGLEVALRPQAGSGSMQKIFLLGAV